MKAISLLIFLVLAAVAAATNVATTPYDPVYAWYINQILNAQAVYSYLYCLYGTHLLSFFYGDGGYSLYLCLAQHTAYGNGLALQAQA